MSFKSRCKNVEHYSGNGKVLLSNADEVVVHTTSDFDVLNYKSRSNEELFLEDEVIVALGSYTSRAQAVTALKLVIKTIEGIKPDRWNEEDESLKPKPKKQKLTNRLTKLGKRSRRFNARMIVHSAPAHYEEIQEVYKKHFGNIELLPPRSRLQTK